MRKKWLLYVLIISTFFSCMGKKVVVSGNSELFNPGDSLSFASRALDDFPLQQFFTYKTVVDANHGFKIEIPLNKDGFISFSAGLTFYASTSDVISIDISPEAKVTYKGKYAALNNAIASFKMSESALLTPVMQKYFVGQDELNYSFSLITDIEAAMNEKREALMTEFSLNDEENKIFADIIAGYQKRIFLITSIYLPQARLDALPEKEKDILTKVDISIPNSEKSPAFLSILFLKTVEDSIRSNRMTVLNFEEINKKIASYNVTQSTKDDLYAYFVATGLSQLGMSVGDSTLFQTNKSQIENLMNSIKNKETKKIVEDFWKESLAYFTPQDNTAQANSLPKAVNFTVEDHQGNKVQLTDFKGKVVFLDFWATWCAPCLEQIPFLEKIQEKYKNNQNVVFLSVSVDATNDKEKWRNFVKNKALKGISTFAGDAHPDLVNYNVNVLPTFYLVSKTGNLLEGIAPQNEKELSTLIDQLLTE